MPPSSKPPLPSSFPRNLSRPFPPHSFSHHPPHSSHPSSESSHPSSRPSSSSSSRPSSIHFPPSSRPRTKTLITPPSLSPPPKLPYLTSKSYILLSSSFLPIPSSLSFSTLAPPPSSFRRPSSSSLRPVYSSYILMGKKIHQQREVASLTKIMTLWTVLKFVEKLQLFFSQNKENQPPPLKNNEFTNNKGDLSLSPLFFLNLPVTKRASTMIGTTSNIRYGDSLSIWDLLHCLMLPSGNDAAVCLSEGIGTLALLLADKEKAREKGAIEGKGRGGGGEGDESLQKLLNILENQVLEEEHLLSYAENHFVEMMNLNARELELLDSRFSNPTGLANKHNLSTAFDIAKLCVYGLRNPLFYKIVNTQQYIATPINKFQIKKTLKPEENYTMKSNNGFAQKYEENRCHHSSSKRSLFLENTNKLLKKGFKGVKTGITDSAGPCLAVAYKDVVCVILKCRTMERRWEEVEGLVKWEEEGRRTVGCKEVENRRMTAGKR